jgi:PAS domain S-box-containing protein
MIPFPVIAHKIFFPMGYEFNSLCYIRFISGVFALFLMGALWKHRKTDGVIYLIIFEFSAAIWALCDGFEAAAMTLNQKMPWAQFSYLGIATSSTMFLLFALSYANISRFKNWKTLISLLIVPAITMTVVLTNSNHHLIWSRIELIETGHHAVYYYGAYFWFQAIYQYLLLLMGIILLMTAAFRVYSQHRTQFWIVITGTLFPFCSSIIYVFKLLPLKGFDPTPVSFILSGFIITYGIFWFGMFNIMPIARKQAIDNLRDGMVVVDSAGIIVDANPAFCKIFGLELADVLTKQARDFFLSAGIDINSFSVENDYAYETQITVDKEQQDIEVKYHGIADSKNQPLGGIYMIANITTRKMILDAIADSNKRRKHELIEKEKLIMDLDAYARSVAHDLKNPLGSLVGLSELIREKLAQNDLEEVDEMVEIVCEQSKKMTRIIEGLLMLSRIRKEDIVKSPVNTKEILDEVLLRLKTEIVSRSAVLRMPDRWPVVMAHSQWIEEVWSNLISNALKYGGKPPVITLGYEKISPFVVRFWIQDNGNGLPEISLKKIFRDFERLGVTDSDGYGLGLPIVRRIFEKLGSEIVATSSGIPGEGCIFSFTLKEVPLSGKDQ